MINRKQRNGQQVVLYNEGQRRIILSDDSSLKFGNPGEIPNPITSSTNCRLCHRPLNFIEGDGNYYINSDYFRVLDEAHRVERISSRKDTELPNVKNIPKSAFNQGYYGRFFREGRKLGHGAMGSVFLAQHVLESESLGEYAVKKVAVGDNIEWLHRMLKEVHVMETLRHPNIISYKHTWLEIHRQSQFAPSVPFIFILMEFANGGNLEDLVLSEVIDVNNPQRPISIKDVTFLPIRDILRIFLGVCRGLEYLHSVGIIHRDVKPSNILLDYSRESVNIPNVLISDFGECNLGGDARSRTGGTGTIEFCAPELFNVDEQGRYLVNHSKSTDMWSLGMVLYFLLFGGQLPYSNPNIGYESLTEELRSLKAIKLPDSRNEDIPPILKSLLSRLLSIEPSERPTAREARSCIEQLITLSQPWPSSPDLPRPVNLLPGNNKWGTIQWKVISSNLPFLSSLLVVAIGLGSFCYPKSMHYYLILNLIALWTVKHFGISLRIVVMFLILEFFYFTFFESFRLCAI